MSTTPHIIPAGQGLLQRGAELEVHLLSNHPAGGTFTITLEEEHVAEAFVGLYEARKWEEIGEFFGVALMRLMALTPPTPDGDENYRHRETREAFAEQGLPQVIEGIKKALHI